MCIDTESGATCECSQGFFGVNIGANGHECFDNDVFENMIQDMKQIYRNFMDTYIPTGKPQF